MEGGERAGGGRGENSHQHHAVDADLLSDIHLGEPAEVPLASRQPAPVMMPIRGNDITSLAYQGRCLHSSDYLRGSQHCTYCTKLRGWEVTMTAYNAIL